MQQDPQRHPVGRIDAPVPQPAFQARTVARLAALPTIDCLSWSGLRVVVALRALARCSEAGREPMAELAGRLGSVSRARAFMAFADTLGHCWPEPMEVQRPCCRVVGPDEATLAAMVEAARLADRDAFGQAVEGFIRPDRHEPLFGLTLEIAAMFAELDRQVHN